MIKLFLASYFAGAAGMLPGFAGEDLTGKKVVFIPTAGLHEMSDKDREALDYINETDKEALQSLGFVVKDLEVSGASHQVIEEAISNADAIFVCGGSTFFLMQELKRTGAGKLISRHIEKGKLYMGTSAGSIIVQKDIVADGVDDPTIYPALSGDTSALGFIDFYLYVHYGGHYWGNDDEIFGKYYAHLNCVKLSDKQAVIVDGDKIEIVTAA